MPERGKVKNPAAVKLGRLGGRKGGGKSILKLAPEERTRRMREVAAARWRAKHNLEPAKTLGAWLADDSGTVPAPNLTVYTNQIPKKGRKPLQTKRK